MKTHEETTPETPGFDRLGRAEILQLLGATESELERGLALGLPQNQDGTFHFVRVLAWIERTVGDVHGTKRQ